MKKLILTLALISSSSAFAATEVWEGAGSLFDVQGNTIGDYQLKVENSKDGNKTQSQVTITLPKGQIITENCSITNDEKGWKSECGPSKGGGQCLGEGLCISYEEDGTGKAYATTIVMDGPSDMRMLRTELQAGKAVRLYREKLHKK